MRVLLALSPLLLALAGCTDGPESPGGPGDGGSRVLSGEAHVEAGGRLADVETLRVECGAQAQVQVEIGGHGRMRVDVEDGAGRLVFTATTPLDGGVDRDVAVNGTAGVWTLTVDPGAGGYNGRWDVRLACKP